MNRARWLEIGFAAVGTIVVLWQMLLPGYVLTLDLVFGPSHLFHMPTGFLNSFPLYLVTFTLSLVIPAWLVEKLLLVFLFFLLFYLPLRYFPEEFLWPVVSKVELARYWTALFYAINPFVYERFLAGHWSHLFAYAILAPLFYHVVQLMHHGNKKNALWVSFWVLLIGICSLHTFVMSVIFLAAAGATAVVRNADSSRTIARYFALSLGTILLVSLYWIIPALAGSHAAPVSTFDATHEAAYKTAIDPYVGAIGNVALLYGFWGERYQWWQLFVNPKTIPTFWPGAIALLTLVGVGVTVLIRREKSGTLAVLLCSFAVFAFIFSLGIAESPFRGFNVWLFDHVHFWKGFRDTQKWSMWLAFLYAYAGAAGATWLANKIERSAGWRNREYVIWALFAIPLLYTFPMLGGFSRQLHTVAYPESWYQINSIISKDADCRALFLPWHQYYSLTFNHEILTANPSQSFFDCEIVAGQNSEIGDVAPERASAALHALITSNATSSNSAVIDALQKEGIRYIILTSDLVRVDPYRYPFLGDKRLEKLGEMGTGTTRVVLYRVPPPIVSR